MEIGAERANHVLREVERTDGHAAGRDHQVRVERARESLGVHRGIVGDDAEIDDLGPRDLRRGRRRVAVGRHDPVAAAHEVELVDVDQLVARRENRHARSPMHLDRSRSRSTRARRAAPGRSPCRRRRRRRRLEDPRRADARCDPRRARRESRHASRRRRCPRRESPCRCRREPARRSSRGPRFPALERRARAAARRAPSRATGSTTGDDARRRRDVGRANRVAVHRRVVPRRMLDRRSCVARRERGRARRAAERAPCRAGESRRECARSPPER